MADLTKVRVEAFLIDEECLGESMRKWFYPTLNIEDFENFRSSIQLTGSPASQWCELIIVFAKIFNEDTQEFKEVPHMLWRDFDEFKKEYLIDKNIPGCRFITDESIKNQYQYMLEYADI